MTDPVPALANVRPAIRPEIILTEMRGLNVGARRRSMIGMRYGPLIAALFVLGPAAWALAEPVGTPIDHPLFDANRCLTEIRPSREESAVEFHWGCAEQKLITISCVFDRTGYLGLGPGFARPGWHCNHPLPVLEDENGHRISDVAVGDPHGRSVWAACAVTDLGDFAARAKPYHGTACYRAMIRIKKAVNRDGSDPGAVAAEILP